MPANTTKLPSEKANASDARRHMPTCSFHTSGIGIARIIVPVRMLTAPITVEGSITQKHVFNRHQ